MVDVSEDGEPIFDSDGPRHATTWSHLRHNVYTHLMLARQDLAAKIMLIFAVVEAYLNGELEPSVSIWTLTDDIVVRRLLASSRKTVRETAVAWLTGRWWALAEASWMEGQPPPYSDVYEFGKLLTGRLDRPCFAYRIADKRNRPLSIRLMSGDSIHVGRQPRKWLLAVASSRSRPFTIADNQLVVDVASQCFKSNYLGPATEERNEEATLFGDG